MLWSKANRNFDQHGKTTVNEQRNKDLCSSLVNRLSNWSGHAQRETPPKAVDVCMRFRGNSFPTHVSYLYCTSFNALQTAWKRGQLKSSKHRVRKLLASHELSLKVCTTAIRFLGIIIGKQNS